MSDEAFKYRYLTESEPHTLRDLVRLMEECAEVQMAAAKLLRFGRDNWHPDDPKRETNLEALRRECADLTSVIRDLMLDIPSPTPPEESHP